jgi:hypothetical protein
MEPLEEFTKLLADRERIKEAGASADAARDRIGSRMMELVPLIALVPMPGELSVYATTDEGAFSTQPGAVHYAEQFANVLIHEAATGGIVATKERVPHGWRVVVPLDTVCCEVLKMRAGLPTSEFIRLCWKHGINPRCILPFPHGLEEKYGLDFFGGWVKKPEGSVS